jgi:hypothetical protein
MSNSQRTPGRDPLLERLEPPQPPAELRNRALGAAIEALQREPVPDVWERLWHSRWLRLAWSLSMVGLIGAHALISTKHEPGFGTRPITVASTARALDAEIAEIARLPRINRGAVLDLLDVDRRSQKRQGESS